jgi:hypothetical protein
MASRCTQFARLVSGGPLLGLKKLSLEECGCFGDDFSVLPYLNAVSGIETQKLPPNVQTLESMAADGLLFNREVARLVDHLRSASLTIFRGLVLNGRDSSGMASDRTPSALPSHILLDPLLHFGALKSLCRDP